MIKFKNNISTDKCRYSMVAYQNFLPNPWHSSAPTPSCPNSNSIRISKRLCPNFINTSHLHSTSRPKRNCQYLSRTFRLSISKVHTSQSTKFFLSLSSKINYSAKSVNLKSYSSSSPLPNIKQWTSRTKKLKRKSKLYNASPNKL